MKASRVTALVGVLVSLVAQVCGGEAKVKTVRCGEASTVAVTSEGFLWGTGSNQWGQLGDGTQIDRTTLVPVARDVASVSCGFNHTLFVKTDGGMWATGKNVHGQLGVQQPTSRNSYLGPLPDHYVVPFLSAIDVAAAAGGSEHSFLLKPDGTLFAMGDESWGQTGTEFTFFRFSLVEVWLTNGIASPKQVDVSVTGVAAGSTHSAYLKADGSLWASGANAYGEIGVGPSGLGGYGGGYPYVKMSPVRVASGVFLVAAGWNHTVFIKLDGTLWATGANASGQLGDGTTINRSAPTQVASDVASIAAGKAHTLFIKSDHTLWAMGDNSFGQLGDGTTTNRSTPVQVATDVTAVAAGAHHTAFVKTDGTLWAVGDNRAGQLGDGTTISRSTPMAVAVADAVRIVMPPSSHRVAVGYPSYLAVNLAGDGSATYQWRKNGVEIPGATGSSFLVPFTTLADAGEYTVTVTTSFGPETSSVAILTVGPAVSAPGDAADFNGDGKADLLWQNAITRERAMWMMDGTNFLSASSLGTFEPGWSIAATGDFNGDGKTDIVWSSDITGERALWLMNGPFLLGISTFGIFPLEWTVAATGDFDGDGKPDLVWSNSITGERALWLMDGTIFKSASTLGVFPLEWTVAATGDFNADGKPDIVWSNSVTGERAIWLMNGTTFLGASTLGMFPLEWTVAGTADFNADGKPDLIWSNSVTGERALWLMNGTTFLGASTLGIFPLEWTVSN